MDNTNTTIQEVLCIKRTTNGRTYTVKIHFNTETKETAKDKVKRLLTRSCKASATPDKAYYRLLSSAGREPVHKFFFLLCSYHEL